MSLLIKNDLQKCVESKLQRKEILDFVKEKYPLYAWSLRTFCRRLKHFGISYIDYNTNLDHVEEAVREEMDGPGRLLGYRALHKKVREVHGLKVPRNLVYAMIENVDSSGLGKEEELGNQSDQLEQKDLYQWYKIIASKSSIAFFEYFAN